MQPELIRAPYDEDQGVLYGPESQSDDDFEELPDTSTIICASRASRGRRACTTRFASLGSAHTHETDGLNSSLARQSALV